MSTVYVVAWVGYETYSIYKICSTEALAKFYYNKLKEERVSDEMVSYDYYKEEADSYGMKCVEEHIAFLNSCTYPADFDRNKRRGSDFPAVEEHELME